MKGVYIAHPIAGDVRGNIEKVKEIVRKLWRSGDAFPIAPYLTPLDLEWNDDENPYERARGLMIDCEFVKRADELWLYGDRISTGMWLEVSTALAAGIPVIPKTDGTKADLEGALGIVTLICS